MSAELADAFARVVEQRRSMRGFLAEPVPESIRARIFSLALSAPSNCNTQPWFVHVASGQALERLRKRLPDDFAAGRISPDFPYDGQYEGVYRDRQYAAAQALYGALGIEHSDRAARQQAFMENFRFFGAPHVAFFFMPAGFGLREACDLGMFAQTVMLGMAAHGLGSCPQTALGFMADAVREELGIDAEQRLLFGLSFGVPDPAHPANACLTDREVLERVVFDHD
jgi:nitroreductase